MRALPANCQFSAVDGCLFALAPRTNQRAGSVSRFCPSDGGWEHIATTAPIQYWGSSCAYDRCHLYGTFEDRVQSLNVSTGQWEELPPLSEDRVEATPCVVDGRLFIIGGGTASVEEYVASEQRWVSIPDMPRALVGAAAVALDG